MKSVLNQLDPKKYNDELAIQQGVIRRNGKSVLCFGENEQLQIIPTEEFRFDIRDAGKFTEPNDDEELKVLSSTYFQNHLKTKPLLSPPHRIRNHYWVFYLTTGADSPDKLYVITATLAKALVGKWKTLGWKGDSLSDFTPRNVVADDVEMSGVTSQYTKTPSPPQRSGSTLSNANDAEMSGVANANNIKISIERISVPAASEIPEIPRLANTGEPEVKIIGCHFPRFYQGQRDPSNATRCIYKLKKEWKLTTYADLEQAVTEQQLDIKSDVVCRVPETGQHPESDKQLLKLLFPAYSPKLQALDYEVLAWFVVPNSSGWYCTAVFKIVNDQWRSQVIAKRKKLGVDKADLEDPIICSGTDYRNSGGKFKNRDDLKAAACKTEEGLKWWNKQQNPTKPVYASGRGKTPGNPTEMEERMMELEDITTYLGKEIRNVRAEMQAMMTVLENLTNKVASTS
jgi:hypothetical protein